MTTSFFQLLDTPILYDFFAYHKAISLTKFGADRPRIRQLRRYRPHRYSYPPSTEGPNSAVPTYNGKRLKTQQPRHSSSYIVAQHHRHSTDITNQGSWAQRLIGLACAFSKLQGILTILRDRTTSRGDFIFFVDRLSTYLIEKAVEQLPSKPKSVVTPIDEAYEGKTLAANVRTFYVIRWMKSDCSIALRRYYTKISSVLLSRSAKF